MAKYGCGLEMSSGCRAASGRLDVVEASGWTEICECLGGILR